MLVLCYPSGTFALYDGYMLPVDGLCSIDSIYGNWSVSGLMLLNVLF